MRVKSCQRSRFSGLACAGALLLGALSAGCSDDEPGDAPSELDGGRDGSTAVRDAQVDGRVPSDPDCRSKEMIACACKRDPVCCTDAWDVLCDAVAEAFSCGTCDPNGPNAPGDPGWFDPDYRPDGGVSDAGAGMCIDYRMDAVATAPDILVLLDRSGSMRTRADDRFGPASRAVEAFGTAMSDATRVGLMTFPGDCAAITDTFARASCELGASGVFGDINCQPGQMKVAPARLTATAISSQLDLTTPGGASPIAESLQAANQALAAMPDLSTNQIVMLITDGAPNCARGSVGPVGEGTREGWLQAIADSAAAIDDLRKSGVRTFVLGYAVSDNVSLKSTLDRMASAGGTGVTTHYPVADSEALQSTMLGIARQASGCTLTLGTPLIAPAALQIKLDGEPLRRDEKNGYKLSADRNTFTLQGTACTTFTSGPRHVLFVKAACPIPSRPGDAGIADGGGPDAGLSDASTRDAGTTN